MRMKEVCEKTGLTDRAVRLYIESALLFPEEERNYNGRRTIHFSENDVAILKSVATLRKAGFSIADIREMQQSRKMIPAVLESHKQKLAGDIENKRRILHTLEKCDGSFGLDCFRLAELLDGSASSNILPKEDSMMHLKDFQRTVGKRIPSVLAFALLVLGCVVLLPVFIQAAFAKVELLGMGEVKYVYTLSWENFVQSTSLLVSWLASAAAAVMMLLHVAKGKRFFAACGGILCFLSFAILLFLPEEVQSNLSKFEFYSYRNSFLWVLWSEESGRMDFLIQSLKYMPPVFSAALAFTSVFRNKETE